MKGGWLDYARQKTGISRRIPLWPETVEAIKSALEKRRSPIDDDEKRLVFIGPRGKSYVGKHRGSRVTAEADRGMKKSGIEGRTFYDLRRTFQTVAEGSHDFSAVQHVMGHAAAGSDMSAIYRQSIDDSRLRAVVNVVHDWLFGEVAPESKGSGFDGKRSE